MHRSFRSPLRRMIRMVAQRVYCLTLAGALAVCAVPSSGWSAAGGSSAVRPEAAQENSRTRLRVAEELLHAPSSFTPRQTARLWLMRMALMLLVLPLAAPLVSASTGEPSAHDHLILLRAAAIIGVMLPLIHWMADGHTSVTPRIDATDLRLQQLRQDLLQAIYTDGFSQRTIAKTAQLALNTVNDFINKDTSLTVDAFQQLHTALAILQQQPNPARRLAVLRTHLQVAVDEGWTRLAIAEAAGVSSGTITLFLQGRGATPDMQRRIWKGLRSLQNQATEPDVLPTPTAPDSRPPVRPFGEEPVWRMPAPLQIDILRRSLQHALSRGYSQRKIAREAGVPSARISLFLAGKRVVNHSTRQKLFTALERLGFLISGHYPDPLAEIEERLAAAFGLTMQPPSSGASDQKE